MFNVFTKILYIYGGRVWPLCTPSSAHPKDSPKGSIKKGKTSYCWNCLVIHLFVVSWFFLMFLSLELTNSTPTPVSDVSLLFTIEFQAVVTIIKIHFVKIQPFNDLRLNSYIFLGHFMQVLFESSLFAALWACCALEQSIYIDQVFSEIPCVGEYLTKK